MLRNRNIEKKLVNFQQQKKFIFINKTPGWGMSGVRLLIEHMIMLPSLPDSTKFSVRV